MAFEVRERCMVSIITALLFCSLPWVRGEQQVPCFFIFGDSQVDNGNNNGLSTMVKSNFLPYGIDFLNGNHPTGRFSNGRTVVDITAELLGFKSYIPSFADSRRANSDILQGINYASAASGIRDETGKTLGDRVTFNQQLKNHREIISRIRNIIGRKESRTNYLSACLYYVAIGSNDYFQNYFRPEFYQTSHIYTPDQYAEVLIQQYSEQIKTLYNYGARKVALHGLPPIGCLPFEISSHGTVGGTCVETINTEVQIFNNRLRSLVDELNKNLTNAKFVYVNTYDLTLEQVVKPSSFGFTVTNKPCCEVGKSDGIQCVPQHSPCTNRTEYLFWDGSHPTDASNKIVAERSYHAQSATDVYPMDIYSLTHLC